ncbi:MAG TPA: hypothetical protein VNL74_00195 [Methylococcus sp.]|nr:hypothetical protein [Methylococcus sp.]
MGTLTDDMTRLRGEINAMREGRHAMQRELAQTIATLKRDVANAQAAFRRAHADMAKMSRKKRVAFVTDLSRQVADLLRVVADDLKGARQAWRG